MIGKQKDDIESASFAVRNLCIIGVRHDKLSGQMYDQTWYFCDGSIPYDYTGTIEYEGQTYYISGGVVQPSDNETVAT